MALTGRLGLLALLGVPVVAVLGSWAGVLAFDLVLLVLVVADLVLAGSVRGLQLARSGDRAVRLGEPATVTLTVANPEGRRVHGWVRDAWPPSAGAVAQRYRLDVPPRQARRVTTTLVPTRRGDRMADRVTVRSVGPLGLAARQGSHALPWTLRALPPFLSRRYLPSRLARLRDLEGRTPVLVRGQGTEFDSLREYVEGDDVRSIDWRASARAGDVMVRTWRPERDRHLLLVLDAGRTAAGRVGDAPRLDAAMDAALLLAALASRAGDRVDLLVHDRVVRAAVQGRTASELLPALVTAMAPLEARLVEPDWRSVAAEVLTRAPRRSLVVLLTALDPAPVENGLLPVLPRLTARHRVLLASVADPRVGELARGRGDAEAAYGAAAAERTQLDRARVAARLASLGVEVVDAPPERLPPRLADAYLALKAAGRL
ncbi:MAG TPA: DUF58 domain-containing protein [Actinomycetes bacterium]